MKEAKGQWKKEEKDSRDREGGVGEIDGKERHGKGETGLRGMKRK